MEQVSTDLSGTFPSFSHRFSGGLITFHSNNRTFAFDLKDTGIGDFLFRLPVGEYLLEMEIPPASLYGQESGSFLADPGNISITEITDTITVQAEANCALLLVQDDQEQLEEGIYMIERHSITPDYFRAYPLSLDTLSGLFYTYFTPDTVPSDPSAFLWLYGSKPGTEEGGLSTAGFEIGHQYFIKVLE
ncbi:MAG: hypothetical protein R6U78_13010 [Bacteroidales bacterium]